MEKLVSKKAIQVLTSDQLDWVSFNGFREKLYLKKRKAYSQEIGDESWGQVLSCTYFADAYLKPGASTGLHHHDNVCIVTVVTSGVLTHEDSEGNSINLESGQHMIQRTGTSGFKHNESNYTDSFTGILQLWFDVAEWEVTSRNVIEVVNKGMHSDLLGPSSPKNKSNIAFESYHEFKGSIQVNSDQSLIFCYSGSLDISDHGINGTYKLVAGEMTKAFSTLEIASGNSASFIVICGRENELNK